MFRFLFLATLTLQASAFAPCTQYKTKTSTALDMDRRTALTTGAAFLVAGALPAFADPVVVNRASAIPADNEIVKEQRQVPNKLDVNNSPVGDYMKYPGLYPTIGGKIANNGPYKNVDEVFNLNLLSAAEKAKLKEYKSELVATPATGLDPLRGRDPYRASFNQYKEVKTNVIGS